MSMINVAYRENGNIFSFCGHGREVERAVKQLDFSNLGYEGTEIRTEDAGLVVVDLDNNLVVSNQSYCRDDEITPTGFSHKNFNNDNSGMASFLDSISFPHHM